MALNTFKCNYLTPLHFKGLSQAVMSEFCKHINAAMFIFILAVAYYSCDTQQHNNTQCERIILSVKSLSRVWVGIPGHEIRNLIPQGCV